MIMDNFSMNVTGRGDEGLRLALRLAFLGHYAKARATCWRMDDHDGSQRLVFGGDNRLSQDGWHPLPAPLDSDAAADMAARWLAGAEFGRQPDHDGSNDQGWTVHVGPWGHVQPYGYGAFVAVIPTWAVIGK